jgi:chemotaxis-related protein WspD
VLVFRLSNEWLALRVQSLIEVTHLRAVHRVPHRNGLLAGMVNVRGELQLCVHLNHLLGITSDDSHTDGTSPGGSRRGRLLVVQDQADRWVFPVDEVDQVHRLSAAELTAVPATLARSAARLTRGVFFSRNRAVGFLDDARLFQTLRTRIR